MTLNVVFIYCSQTYETVFINSSQEAASDTWPEREPPADGDFLALVRWRAGLRWASNEGAVNLAVSEFPEVSGSSARKRVGVPLSARPSGDSECREGRSRAISPRPLESTGRRHIREPETTPIPPPAAREQAAPKMSVPRRRRPES